MSFTSRCCLAPCTSHSCLCLITCRHSSLYTPAERDSGDVKDRLSSHKPTVTLYWQIIYIWKCMSNIAQKEANQQFPMFRSKFQYYTSSTTQSLCLLSHFGNVFSLPATCVCICMLFCSAASGSLYSPAFPVNTSSSFTFTWFSRSRNSLQSHSDTISLSFIFSRLRRATVWQIVIQKSENNPSTPLV